VPSRRVEQLGDAEVEQVRPPLPVHQDVGGFEVAVQHQALVGVLHRLADRHEELEAAGEVESASLAPGVDRRAVDVLEHQKGEAAGGAAGVEQAGDPRVVEGREQPALLLEPGHEGPRVERSPHQLDRHRALEGAVGPARAVDHAHAAAPGDPLDLPGAEPRSGREVAVRLRARLAEDLLPGRALQSAAAGVVGGEQRLDLGGDRAVHLRGEAGGAPGRGQLGETIEQLARAAPARRGLGRRDLGHGAAF